LRLSAAGLSQLQKTQISGAIGMSREQLQIQFGDASQKMGMHGKVMQEGYLYRIYEHQNGLGRQPRAHSAKDSQ
jgi:hypothetical protein